ncbi:hypothetical protein Gorai_013956, partial [Gossypium raimondii]|nr:hypothetical protein [Gossypium raimondii]
MEGGSACAPFATGPTMRGISMGFLSPRMDPKEKENKKEKWWEKIWMVLKERKDRVTKNRSCQKSGPSRILHPWKERSFFTE